MSIDHSSLTQGSSRLSTHLSSLLEKDPFTTFNITSSHPDGVADISVSDISVLGMATPVHPKKDHIIYLTKPVQITSKLLESGNCFLGDNKLFEGVSGELTKKLKETTCLLLNDPRQAREVFIHLLNVFNPYQEFPTIRALNEQDANKFKSQFGINSVVGEDVEVGEGSMIYSGVYLGPGVKLGRRVTVYPNSVIHAGTVIGDDCIVHSGVVIGDDGFGYQSTPQGSWKIPQIGGVQIGSQVEIGSNCCIDRGTIDDTVIGDRVKIDNLVQIAHNVEIGSDSIVVSQVGIAGSSKIGRRVVLAGQVGLGDHAEIGDDAQIGGQSGVMSGQKIAAGSSVWGTPPFPYRTKLKMDLALKKMVEKK